MITADMNILYDGFRATMRGSGWKREPQRFAHNWLHELCCLKHEQENKTYHTLPGSEFILNERGSVRHIHGGRTRDRVVRHALCDEVIGPGIKPYLIHNNGASQKNKGLSFARRLFETDLHNYFLQNGNNEGVVVFGDFSKFYDNIEHAKIRKELYPKLPDDEHWLMDEILHNMEVDVSYMTDAEFAACMSQKFNSVEYYRNVPKEARTGEKMMPKSVDIGDQVSQHIGVFFPYRIDNYVKIVRGLKFYGRYNDDFYYICKTKEEALSVMEGIAELAKEMGVYINQRKTHIVKLSGKYKYLQVRYSLTASGKVIKRINPKTVTRERRKLKAYKRLLDKGKLPYEDIEQAYKSWMGVFTKLMSKQQILNMRTLYKKLFGKDARWKKSLSPLKTVPKLKQTKTATATSWTPSRFSLPTYRKSMLGMPS